MTPVSVSDHQPALCHRVQGETTIAAPASSVWEVLSDFYAVDRWAPLVWNVSVIGEAKPGLGAARHCDIRYLGGIDEVVTVWDEGRRLGYRVTPVGPIGTSESLWEIESIGEKTARVALRLDYAMRFGAVGGLLNALLVRRVLARNVPGALGLLRRRVEGRRPS